MIVSPFEAYKTWVKANPGIVQGVEWLLYAFQWNPGRLSSSELGYETYHAVLGLISVWHAQILEEDWRDHRRSPYSVWLDMLEQVRCTDDHFSTHLPWGSTW
jgi:peroxin-16